MITTALHILLADDDVDDRFFFREALEELPISAILSTAKDGVQLMQLLSIEDSPLPDVLFLDLNMPRKNGFECLSEIKSIDRLMNLPVIIYSTSFNMEVVDLLYETGANHYICKPGEFDKLKKVILEAVIIISQNKSPQPPRDKFIIKP